MKNNFFEDRMREFLGHLRNLIIVSHKELFGFDYKECGYKTGNALPPVDESFTRLEKGQYWGNAAHVHAWMHKKIEIPENMIGKNIVLHIDTQKDGWNVHNPQFIAYLDGALVQGLDTNHREVYLDAAKSEYDLYLYAYTSSCADPLELRATLFEYDEVVKKLYYTLSIALDTCAMYDKNDKIYADVEKCTIDAINLIDTRKGRSEEFLSSAKKALDLLESRLCGKKTEKTSVVCIGHTHIDVAWLWTLAQTREKVQRSFSNVVALMKKYPEYKFMSSQAQLYKHLKEEAPEIYEEVKKLVKEGRWEVEGSMWVEADCNLSSGESLVRQILYGKQFFKNE
ncbi:MAG: alpha-mannosidase, partial [Clostridia bacterium]|nr:alpha-mannosidase [Clostridia bacterium]